MAEPRGAERSRSVRAVRAAATACECFTLWVRGKRRWRTKRQRERSDAFLLVAEGRRRVKFADATLGLKRFADISNIAPLNRPMLARAGERERERTRERETERAGLNTRVVVSLFVAFF